MQEIQPSDQEMDGNAVETREKVKRGKENVDEEEYDEMKEIQEIAKKRKANKVRENNLKKARLESLQKKKDEDASGPVPAEGTLVQVEAAEVNEGKTSPPKHFTDEICCLRGEWITPIEERSSA